jgi:hypothetical protein
MAGQPSKVGGTIAGIVGWVVLGVGLSLALGLGLLVGALASATAGVLVATPVTFLAVSVALVLLLGGRSLRRSGDEKQKTTWVQAIVAFAANRGGVVTALDAAASTGIPAHEADALLTELAKTQPERVVLDVDESGTVLYRFPPLVTAGPGAWEHHVRVAPGGYEPDAGHPTDLEGEALSEAEAQERTRSRR